MPDLLFHNTGKHTTKVVLDHLDIEKPLFVPPDGYLSLKNVPDEVGRVLSLIGRVVGVEGMVHVEHHASLSGATSRNALGPVNLGIGPPSKAIGPVEVEVMDHEPGKEIDPARSRVELVSEEDADAERWAQAYGTDPPRYEEDEDGGVRHTRVIIRERWRKQVRLLLEQVASEIPCLCDGSGLCNHCEARRLLRADPDA